MLSRLLPFVLAAFASFPGNAQDLQYRCTYGSAVREILVERAHPPDRVPCAVRYRKPSEGIPDAVPYRADTDPNFCSEKAVAMRRGLEDKGWTCEALHPDGNVTDETEPDDISAALADSEAFQFWATELGRTELIAALVVERVPDLNGDGDLEYLVRINHAKVEETPIWSGAELLSREDKGFRHLFSGVLEIRVLASQTGGYRDIAVLALPTGTSQTYRLAKYTGVGYRAVEIHRYTAGEQPTTHVERSWDEAAGGFAESETLEGASEIVKRFR